MRVRDASNVGSGMPVVAREFAEMAMADACAAEDPAALDVPGLRRIIDDTAAGRPA